MENTTNDRRVQKTRHALHRAFVELVLARGYEAVTIGAIIEQANVGRSTFYSHYTSKEDLLEESLTHPCNGLAACVDTAVTVQDLAPLLEHFMQQSSINRIFFEPPLRSLWVLSLAKRIEPRLPREGRPRPTKQPSLTALLVAETQIALIAHWLLGRFPLEPPAVAGMLLTNTRALLAAQFPDTRERTSVALNVG